MSNKIEVLPPLSEEDCDWLKFGQLLLKEAPDVIDSEAKSLVALGSSLLTVYASVLTIFKIPDKLDLPIELKIMLFIFPICFWLICIGVNTWVYFPGLYEFDLKNIESIKDNIKNITKIKYSRLRVGAVFFIIALTWSTIAISLMSIHIYFQTEVNNILERFII